MRTVVVGAGMVGHRLAQKLTDLDPDADVVVLGEEQYEPYNRAMLSELVAGRVNVSGLTLPSPGDADLRLSVRVVDVDRDTRTVRASDGRTTAYDHLVLATGARARVPALPGLLDPSGDLPSGVHVLRTVDDARAILAGAANARRVTVVGAGAIGVEVACGLRHRDLDVALVASRDGVLDRDLDTAASDVASLTVRDLGVRFVPRASVASLVHERGRLRAVRLSNGRRLPTDLLVLAVGSVPETLLARRMGLDVDRGVVVDTELRTSDPHISAIGDCARTPTGLSGLIAPGWAQAHSLARRLVLDEPVSTPVVDGAAMRLKAAGLSAVSMGTRASTARPEDRVVALDDHRARRHVEVVVRQGTLVGLTCVGAPDLASRLSTLFERPGIVPVDPLQLLAGGGKEEQASATTLEPNATVCRCNGVTRRDVESAWHECEDVDGVVAATRATTGCGGCTSLVCELVEWLAEASDVTSQDASADREASVSVG